MQPTEEPVRLEALPHDTERVITGLTMSPEGKKCISMTFGGREFILLGLYRGPMGTMLQRELAEGKAGKPVQSIIGIAFDIQKSLAEGKLQLSDSPGATGIYVEAEYFDKLLIGLPL